jgi:hypothetical protein
VWFDSSLSWSRFFEISSRSRESDSKNRRVGFFEFEEPEENSSVWYAALRESNLKSQVAKRLRRYAFFVAMLLTKTQFHQTDTLSSISLYNKKHHCLLKQKLSALRSIFLSPVYIWLTSAKPVSCYAFAVAWLLPSLSTGCLCGGIAYSTEQKKLVAFDSS